jgi:hypothetical protein
VAGLFVLVAPWILGFSDQGVPRNFFVAMGILILIVAALTDYAVRESLPPRQPDDRRRSGTGETPKKT